MEPWRLVITGKKEFKEEKKEVPMFKEKFNQIYRTVKFPFEVRPDDVQANPEERRVPLSRNSSYPWLTRNFPPHFSKVAVSRFRERVRAAQGQYE